jgi:hypothetical protein
MFLAGAALYNSVCAWHSLRFSPNNLFSTLYIRFGPTAAARSHELYPTYLDLRYFMATLSAKKAT